MKPQDLLGQWTLTRKIFDVERRPVGGMWGTATYESLSENALLYQESVWNQTGESSQFFARQSYLYLFKEKAVEIHREGKEQATPFLKLPYGEKVVDAHYLCRPDLYTLRWVWIHSHFFFTRFSVKGLSKDHTLETQFRR